MSKILGLDLGTNSIGWAVVDLNNEKTLLNKGVHIFSEGVKIEKGNESSKAAERTEKRSARRIKFRRRLRKIETLKVLIDNDMCPLTMEELNEWRMDKKKYPKNEDFMKWLRTDEDNNINPYYFRAKAVEEKLPPHQLGRAFYHMAQRRGFLSNRLDTSEDNNPDGAVKKGISELSEKMGDKTLGQYFYELHKEAKEVRRNYTAREEHYLNEFKKICEVQQLDNEVAKALEKAIFHQRPLKSQKGLVGKCSFEKNKPRCPVSHPLFEEYRMLQFINNIKYKDEEGKFVQLNEEQRNAILPLFYRKSKKHFDFADIRKKLTPKGKTVIFNYKDKTTVSGCPTIAQLIAIFGDDWRNELFNNYKGDKAIRKRKKLTDNKYERTEIIDEKTVDDIVNEVWHILFTFDKDEKLKEWAEKNSGLDEEAVKKFSEIKLKQDYANLSLKAIKKILPYLREGLIYSYAVFLANIENVVGKEIWNNENNQKIIRDELKSIIDSYNEERMKEQIVNDLIARFRDEYNNADKDYVLDQRDKDDVREKVLAVYGPKRFAAKEPEEQQRIITSVEEMYQAQLRQWKSPFIKPKRLDEKIKDFLIGNFNADEKSMEQLYHPSDIEIFKQPKRADDGKLYLVSPMVPSIKNPMAMRTMHQLRKLVNELIKEGEVDEDTKIHIELARELNDRNKRLAIQKWQNERQKKRAEYRDNIIKLYKAECGKEIEPTEDEILKYQLWEEQDHKCLYTGENIGICDFIGADPKYDIEHTIPRSISYDNSQENLTLCSMKFNREVKKNKIPAELSNHTEIHARIEKWKDRYEELEKLIEKAKYASKMAATKEAKDRAIQKKHYLILEKNYWKNKYSRFEMEDVPEGFKNSQLVDTGIITKYARSYLKSVFPKVYSVKGSAVAEFRRLWGLQEEYEKKERVNHIHHCIDAITIACMTKDRYDLLAHYYQADENGNKEQLHKKLKELKPWGTFTEDVKAVEKEVLVSHYTPDNVSKQTKKKLRKRGKIQYNKQGKPIYQQGDTARGSLHKETFYGAIKRNGEEKEKYVLRKFLDTLTAGDIKYIVDDNIRTIVQEIVQRDGIAALKGEVWQNKEKGIRLKKVRCYAPTVTDPIFLKPHRDKSKNEYKQSYHVVNDENYCMALYEGNNEKGKLIRKYELLNLMQAAEYYKLSNKAHSKQYPLIDDVHPKANIPIKGILKKGDLVLFYQDTPEEVWELENEEIQKRLYKIYKLRKDGRVAFRFHQEARNDEQLKLDYEKEYGMKPPKTLTDGVSQVDFNKPHPKLMISNSKMDILIEGIDFSLTITGKIEKL